MKDVQLSDEFIKCFSKRQWAEFQDFYGKFVKSALFIDLENKTPERILDTFLIYLKAQNKSLYKGMNKKISEALDSKIRLHKKPAEPKTIPQPYIDIDDKTT